MGKKGSRNEETRINNKALLREIEQEYTDDNLNVLNELVEVKRHELEDKLTTYLKDNTEKRYDKDGNERVKVKTNPIIVQKYFFQSINPMVNVEPTYSAEKLGIVWQLYEEMIGAVNAKVGVLVPSVSGFCSFAGIRLSTFKKYKSSLDEGMRIVVDKIEDGCFDSNVTLAQMGYIKERTTVYRMKSEQERAEKETSVEHKHTIDTTNVNEILNRVKQLKGFGTKKKAIVGEIVDEREQ